jgi:ech hydrogenase subunit D
MSMGQITEVTIDSLFHHVVVMKQQGYRFATMTCSDLGSQFDVLYHFDKDYNLNNLRLRIDKGVALPSISSLFFAAAIVENEMKDLFGLSVDGLAIDFQGRMILSETAPKAPLLKRCGMDLDIRVADAKPKESA